MNDLVLFHDVSIFDALKGITAANQSLIIEGNTIGWAGPVSAEPAVEGGARVVDGTGSTLIPGLLNCHTHLIGDGDPVDPFTTDLEWAVARAVVAARQTLEGGVTSVRDCGSLNGLAIKLAVMVEKGLIPGPRIFAAGQVITMTGGHCHFFGRQADGPWEVAKAIRAELLAGADFIKIMATGGVLTKGVSPHQTAFAPAELQMAADITHNAGKRITSHAIGAAGVKNAIRAGIDSIEHAIFVDDEIIELALEHGTIIVPTLQAVEREQAHSHLLPDWMRPKAEMVGEASAGSFKKLVDAGVKIAAGSDAGTPFNLHQDFPRELALMVEYGMTPAEAIKAATVTSAENFGVSDTLGTLEVGKLADMLLVAGDPAQDIALLQTAITAVIKDGQFVAEH
jgi:imidazolonepropionase-like amidohydrolase